MQQRAWLPIMLSEKRPASKFTYFINPFMWYSKNDKMIRMETERWLPGLRDDGGGVPFDQVAQGELVVVA